MTARSEAVMVGASAASILGTPAGGTFGDMLRDWRKRRRYSQLALALEAGTSARHLSFLETGRASPSREMVHRLAEQLELPVRERDALLVAAGFAPSRRDAAREEAAVKAAREAVDLVLAGFEPFPALAVDRHWMLLAGNRALEPLLRDVAPALLEPPVNVLRVSLHPEGLAPRIRNLGEWRRHALARLQREAARCADPVLASLLDELRAYPHPRERAAPTSVEDEDPMIAVPLKLATERGTLSLISTTTVFGTAVDVDLAEVTIECFLPGDEPTRLALTGAA